MWHLSSSNNMEIGHFYKIVFALFLPVTVLGETTCKYEDPVGSVDFQACLRLGDRFLKRYTKALRRGRNGRCSHFSDFQHCMTTMTSQCPSMLHSMPSDWLLVYQLYNCACKENDKDHTSCQMDLACFEEQYGGLLGRRCDALFRFNIQQGTKEKCHFMIENIRCKEALVASACGHRAGLLAFHVAKLTLKRSDRCDITHGFEYPGFHYNEKCPTSFVHQMQKCEKDNFDETKLQFFDENDLIAVGGSQNVQLACRGYKGYKTCVGSLENQCPSGTKMVYDFDYILRAYTLKMEYICITDQESYAEHITCYQEILYNQTLKKCNHIFQNLIPLLNQLSAFQFYCQTNNTTTMQALGYLNDLNLCYEDVFTAGCGVNGSKAMIGLMSDAFRDAYYLRYKYQPDCQLHTEDLADVKIPQKDKDYTDYDNYLNDARPESGSASHKSIMTAATSNGNVMQHSQSTQLCFWVFAIILQCIILS